MNSVHFAFEIELLEGLHDGDSDKMVTYKGAYLICVTRLGTGQPPNKT